ncbi:hypothetical protein MIMGU_mgv1a027111mg [Erythranthe guttata]|uniref:C2H2-type domain-containing protein n=1 Tax=Erythranthe guttata TaxID=4155 RepID=A0A022REZ0_ERYGU|nr:hypothetical protein MIMGU_mgv1a027111mg [Erythranthe guttata]
MELTQEEVIFIKGKRSKRSIRAASPLALTMAATSSSTTADSSGAGVVISDISGSCDRDSSDHQEEEDMANCLMLLAGGQIQKPPPSAAAAAAAVEVYQCKTCSKSFSSFQALGGHRASHKRPIKPQTLDHEIKKPPPLKQYRPQEISYSPSNPCADDSSIILSLQITGGGLRSKTTIRVHECSICGAEFASGQALGGHMRRHRPIPTAAAATSNISHGGGESQEMKRPRNNLLSLDLNLPAPEDHDHRDSKFPFAPKEQIIVFSSTSPMVVDCHY